jgi:hypothetical protein
MRSKQCYTKAAGCQTALQRSPSVPSFDSCVENKIIGQRTDGDQNFKYVWVVLVAWIPHAIATAAHLTALWDKFGPIIRAYLGI